MLAPIRTPVPSTWSKTRQRHLMVIQDAVMPDKLHLTGNSKTGLSVDFPPHKTCRPTQVCMGLKDRPSAACYALAGRMTMNAVVNKQAQNYLLAEKLATGPYKDVIKVVDDLADRLPDDQDWLRWNGAGDLTEGSVRLLNSLTARHRSVALWVVSRRPEMVAKLVDRPSLRLLLSLDYSTPEAIAADLRLQAKRFTRGTARLAYTRVAESDKVPKDIDIVFNKHGGGEFYAWKHRNVCHATLPGTTHEKACDSCRRCFAPRKG